MRLLIVEDESRIVEVLRLGLGRAGFVVDAVCGVSDARAALEAVLYDAVVLDLGLPDGDGLKLLCTLWRSGNQVPVLILTARDAVEHRVAGLDAGADDYLVKPFAMIELIARIKTCCAVQDIRLGLGLKPATYPLIQSAGNYGLGRLR